MSRIDNPKWINDWLKIGKQNLGISQAADPPFIRESFSGGASCEDVQDLIQNILHGNWCLGQLFYLDDLCFINQVDGGDEWLTIKQALPFESITFHSHNRTPEENIANTEQVMSCIQQATLEQCKNWST